MCVCVWQLPNWAFSSCRSACPSSFSSSLGQGCWRMAVDYRWGHSDLPDLAAQPRGGRGEVLCGRWGQGQYPRGGDCRGAEWAWQQWAKVGGVSGVRSGWGRSKVGETWEECLPGGQAGDQANDKTVIWQYVLSFSAHISVSRAWAPRWQLPLRHFSPSFINIFLFCHPQLGWSKGGGRFLSVLNFHFCVNSRCPPTTTTKTTTRRHTHTVLLCVRLPSWGCVLLLRAINGTRYVHNEISLLMHRVLLYLSLSQTHTRLFSVHLFVCNINDTLVVVCYVFDRCYLNKSSQWTIRRARIKALSIHHRVCSSFVF